MQTNSVKVKTQSGNLVNVPLVGAMNFAVETLNEKINASFKGLYYEQAFWYSIPDATVQLPVANLPFTTTQEWGAFRVSDRMRMKCTIDPSTGGQTWTAEEDLSSKTIIGTQAIISYEMLGITEIGKSGRYLCTEIPDVLIPSAIYRWSPIPDKASQPDGITIINRASDGQITLNYDTNTIKLNNNKVGIDTDAELLRTQAATLLNLYNGKSKAIEGVTTLKGYLFSLQESNGFYTQNIAQTTAFTDLPKLYTEQTSKFIVVSGTGTVSKIVIATFSKDNTSEPEYWIGWIHNNTDVITWSQLLTNNTILNMQGNVKVLPQNIDTAANFWSQVGGLQKAGFYTGTFQAQVSPTSALLTSQFIVMPKDENTTMIYTGQYEGTLTSTGLTWVDMGQFQPMIQAATGTGKVLAPPATLGGAPIEISIGNTTGTVAQGDDPRFNEGTIREEIDTFTDFKAWLDTLTEKKDKHVILHNITTNCPGMVGFWDWYDDGGNWYYQMPQGVPLFVDLTFTEGEASTNNVIMGQVGGWGLDNCVQEFTYDHTNIQWRWIKWGTKVSPNDYNQIYTGITTRAQFDEILQYLRQNEVNNTVQINMTGINFLDNEAIDFYINGCGKVVFLETTELTQGGKAVVKSRFNIKGSCQYHFQNFSFQSVGGTISEGQSIQSWYQNRGIHLINCEQQNLSGAQSTGGVLIQYLWNDTVNEQYITGLNCITPAGFRAYLAGARTTTTDGTAPVYSMNQLFRSGTQDNKKYLMVNAYLGNCQGWSTSCGFSAEGQLRLNVFNLHLDALNTIEFFNEGPNTTFHNDDNIHRTIGIGEIMIGWTSNGRQIYCQVGQGDIPVTGLPDPTGHPGYYTGHGVLLSLANAYIIKLEGRGLLYDNSLENPTYVTFVDGSGPLIDSSNLGVGNMSVPYAQVDFRSSPGGGIFCNVYSNGILRYFRQKVDAYYTKDALGVFYIPQ